MAEPSPPESGGLHRRRAPIVFRTNNEGSKDSRSCKREGSPSRDQFGDTRKKTRTDVKVVKPYGGTPISIPLYLFIQCARACFQRRDYERPKVMDDGRTYMRDTIHFFVSKWGYDHGWHRSYTKATLYYIELLTTQVDTMFWWKTALDWWKQGSHDCLTDITKEDRAQVKERMYNYILNDKLNASSGNEKKKECAVVVTVIGMESSGFFTDDELKNFEFIPQDQESAVNRPIKEFRASR